MNKYTKALLNLVPHQIDENTVIGLPEGITPDMTISDVAEIKPDADGGITIKFKDLTKLRPDDEHSEGHV